LALTPRLPFAEFSHSFLAWRGGIALPTQPPSSSPIANYPTTRDFPPSGHCGIIITILDRFWEPQSGDGALNDIDQKIKTINKRTTIFVESNKQKKTLSSFPGSV
jgi:hypothetical protein